MKTTYTDKQLQAAIDEACNDTPTTNRITNIDIRTSCAAWKREAPARLALARALLDRLPEPTPPTADGKTPGEVYQDDLYAQDKNTFYKWEEISLPRARQIEHAASAVLAVFGGQSSLEAGITRMEAESQPQVCQTDEIPWIEWHGGECPLAKGTIVDVRYRDGSSLENVPALEVILSEYDASYAFWRHDQMPNDIIAYRVLKYRDGFGPQAEPDWKAKYEEAIDGHQCAIMALDSCQARAEKAEAELAKHKENAVEAKPAYVGYMTDEMPADPYAELKAAHAAGKVIQYNCGSEDKPEWEPVPSPEFGDGVDAYRIKPEPATFTAHGKTWTKHTKGHVMPCEGEALVNWLLAHEVEGGYTPREIKASELMWQYVAAWRYANKPTPPKLIPLDINDIRATDEFRRIDNDHQICAMLHADDRCVKLALNSMNGTFEYATLAKTHLRRQHGSTEWKPCTKEVTANQH